jgi:hypothetical protein
MSLLELLPGALGVPTHTSQVSAGYHSHGDPSYTVYLSEMECTSKLTHPIMISGNILLPDQSDQGLE